MPRIKNTAVTTEMMNMEPLRMKDIGDGAKILVLKRLSDKSFLTCLERDGVRCNFANSSVEHDKHKGCHNAYISKCDGVYEDGTPVHRRVNVTDMIPKRSRVRPMSEKRGHKA